jgi:hypothetical protein
MRTTCFGCSHGPVGRRPAFVSTVLPKPATGRWLQPSTLKERK